MFVLFISISLTHTHSHAFYLLLPSFVLTKRFEFVRILVKKNSIVTKCAFIVDTFKPIGDRVFVKYSLSELYICISFTSILNHRSWKSKTKSICNNQISNQINILLKKKLLLMFVYFENGILSQQQIGKHHFVTHS